MIWRSSALKWIVLREIESTSSSSSKYLTWWRMLVAKINNTKTSPLSWPPRWLITITWRISALKLIIWRETVDILNIKYTWGFYEHQIKLVYDQMNWQPLTQSIWQGSGRRGLVMLHFPSNNFIKIKTKPNSKIYYATIDCSWGEWWKIIVPEVKFNLGLIFTDGAEVNSRPRLNFTEGTIIFYHSPNKTAVNICLYKS